MGGWDACGLLHLDLRWSSYGATKRVMGGVGMRGGTACGRRHLDLRWSSYGATKRVRGMPNWAGRRHANAPTGAVGDAPWEAGNV